MRTGETARRTACTLQKPAFSWPEGRASHESTLCYESAPDDGAHFTRDLLGSIFQFGRISGWKILSRQKEVDS